MTDSSHLGYLGGRIVPLAGGESKPLGPASLSEEFSHFWDTPLPTSSLFSNP